MIIDTLSFHDLPDLLQTAVLQRLCQNLWIRDDVIALWLGGSFARCVADEYSDIDLRVGVPAKNLDDWAEIDLEAVTGEIVVGSTLLRWEGTVLHHLALDTGVIIDLLVHSLAIPPPADATIILGCRDDDFGDLLLSARLPVTDVPGSVEPSTIRKALVEFWLGSLKHTKVLHRNLDMLAIIGLGMEQSTLMRLWFIDGTGKEPHGNRPTIHSLTTTVRKLMEEDGIDRLICLGSARRSRSEICAAIETNRDEIALVGRRLSTRYGFEYPDAIETAVRESWQTFMSKQK